MSESKRVQLDLTEQDAISIVRVIRLRQDDCRKVDERFPMYDKFHKIDLELEGLKFRVLNQMEQV